MKSCQRKNEVRNDPTKDHSDGKVKADGFLADLTGISNKHGIAISGNAVLYLMEPEDHAFHYEIDDESNLIRK